MTELRIGDRVRLTRTTAEGGVYVHHGVLTDLGAGGVELAYDDRGRVCRSWFTNRPEDIGPGNPSGIAAQTITRIEEPTR